MDNRYKMKQAYDLIPLPDALNSRLAELTSGEARPAASGKPIKVHRGGTAVAAGLALAIAAGGIFMTVKLRSSSPDSISSGFTPVSAENKYVRLTLTDLKSDGHILKGSFDLDKLYGSYAGKTFEDYIVHREGAEDYAVSFGEFDDYANSLFDVSLRLTSGDGTVTGMLSGSSRASNLDPLDKYDAYAVFGEKAPEGSGIIDIDTSFYETCTFDMKVLAENISLTADTAKNVTSRKFVTEDGMTALISELGIYFEGEAANVLDRKIKEGTYEDEADFQKKVFTVSVTDVSGNVTSAMLENPHYFSYPENESVPYSVFIGALPIPAGDIEKITILDMTFTED